VWSPHVVKGIELLEWVLKVATRFIPGLRKLDYNGRVKRLILQLWKNYKIEVI